MQTTMMTAESEQTDDPDDSIKRPHAADGACVHDLIAACPPLDQNSLYANLLQCSDFSQTCAIVKTHDRADAWVSGYIPPDQPDVYFLWQVAVRETARGRKLPQRMLTEIFARPICKDVRYLKTTITPDNKASWALFERVAKTLNAPLNSAPHFDKDVHFKGNHESEILVTIGPFVRPGSDS